MPEITDYIPHRPPMLLLDEIVSESEGQLVAKKTFRPDEYFLQGHYPDFPLVPGVILCECGFQAGAVLIAKMMAKQSAASNDRRMPVITRVNDVKFKRMVKPEETIEIEVTFEEQVSTAVFISAKVRCEGKLAASYKFAATLTPAGDV